VLPVENNQVAADTGSWLKPSRLAELVDEYIATVGPGPDTCARATYIGQPPQSQPQSQSQPGSQLQSQSQSQSVEGRNQVNGRGRGVPGLLMQLILQGGIQKKGLCEASRHLN